MKLQANPAGFLEQAIKTHVETSPLNRLKDFDGSPIFGEPLVGFAAGDDPIFREYKDIIGDFHLTPGEILESHAKEQAYEGARPNSRGTAISIVLPFAEGVRAANRRMTDGPSLAWNHARWHGQTCAEDLSSGIVSLLRREGLQAVVPEDLAVYGIRELPDGRCSNWSERHVAYAAGLGTFSLSGRPDYTEGHSNMVHQRGDRSQCPANAEASLKPRCELPVLRRWIMQGVHPAMSNRRH